MFVGLSHELHDGAFISEQGNTLSYHKVSYQASGLTAGIISLSQIKERRVIELSQIEPPDIKILLPTLLQVKNFVEIDPRLSPWSPCLKSQSRITYNL